MTPDITALIRLVLDFGVTAVVFIFIVTGKLRTAREVQELREDRNTAIRLQAERLEAVVADRDFWRAAALRSINAAEAAVARGGIAHEQSGQE